MSGTIEVICGPMFAGKSEELIRRIKRLLIAKKTALIFKHALDTRYDDKKIVAHSGASLDAIPVKDSKELLEILRRKDHVDVVGIDEANFFDDGIIRVVDDLAKEGRHVFVAGLDKDFRGEPFGPMATLLAKADYVSKLDAICMRCGSLATMTQRIVNDKIPHYNDPVKVVGASEKYEARCRKCHRIMKD